MKIDDTIDALIEKLSSPVEITSWVEDDDGEREYISFVYKDDPRGDWKELPGMSRLSTLPEWQKAAEALVRKMFPYRSVRWRLDRD